MGLWVRIIAVVTDEARLVRKYERVRIRRVRFRRLRLRCKLVASLLVHSHLCGNLLGPTTRVHVLKEQGNELGIRINDIVMKHRWPVPSALGGRPTLEHSLDDELGRNAEEPLRILLALANTVLLQQLEVLSVGLLIPRTLVIDPNPVVQQVGDALR